MAKPEITDVDRVLAAIEKAREHARRLGKPIQLDRVAVYLCVSHVEINEAMNYSGSDETKTAIANALKGVKQESRADILDSLSQTGNVTGFIFQGKANHGMVEATNQQINVVPVVFAGIDDIKE